MPRALGFPDFIQNARRAVMAAGSDMIITKRPAHNSSNLLLRRNLTVNNTQKVTLGVIAAYVVVIALLWNLPYVRWSLWPFKVSVLPDLLIPKSRFH